MPKAVPAKSVEDGTDASTLYNGGTCADIQVGTRVQVKGTIQDDGTVLATQIHIKA